MPGQVETRLSEAILTEIPHLRAYARLMTGDVSSADREVSETLKRAFDTTQGLRDGTGFRVQLFTILRNLLVERERAPQKFSGLAAIYERLNRPFRIARAHAERPLSLACALLRLDFEDREAVVLRAGVRLPRDEAEKIIGCEPLVYDARARSGFGRLAELFPGYISMISSPETASCFAFSGMSKAIEMQETPASVLEL